MADLTGEADKGALRLDFDSDGRGRGTARDVHRNPVAD